MSDGTSKRLILAHDRFLFRGGGEHFALEFCRTFGADLLTGCIDESIWSPEELREIHTVSLMRNFRKSGLRTLGYLLGFGLRARQVSKYDIAVYSGIHAPIAVLANAASRNILYCHTPPRLIYDQAEHFSEKFRQSSPRPMFVEPAVLVARRVYLATLRKFYERAVSRMDTIVANSFNIQRRIRKYLGIESQVVYPPCDIIEYRWESQEDYYLSTARIESLKRVHLIAQAFRRLPHLKLIIASSGSDAPRVREIIDSAPNIHMTGWVDQETMQRLVGRCIATIYIPVEEDFGISPVESMAAGKPVIGVAEGGLLETVIDGETGVLLPSPASVEGLIDAVERLDARRAKSMRGACRVRARLFSREVFRQRMQKILVG
ncbi:MAG: glycosyltransferase [Deltaproteobacteria bacterium]|nr:glycosyltransferase [Deltaproteobacteria bacterium]MBW1816719.1 glycosyltransferase [Deltaproteobacteria bacterium]